MDKSNSDLELTEFEKSVLADEVVMEQLRAAQNGTTARVRRRHVEEQK